MTSSVIENWESAIGIDLPPYSAAEVAVGSADADAAWKHFDPCGLLAKLLEVGK